MIARRLAIVLMCAASALSGLALAQVAPPNAAGVAMGHLHYHVRDVAANRRFWLALGGTAAGPSGAEVIAFPGVLIFLTAREASGSSEGAVLNHVAFRVRTFAQVEKTGIAVQRLAQFPGVGTAMTPEGERIELFEDAATNLGFTPDAGLLDAAADRHNHPLTTAVAFHHVHLYLPGDEHLEAKAWYTRLFGGVPGRRAQYDAVDLPGINFNFSGGRTGAPMKGRTLDHIGLEVANLAAFAARLAAIGVRIDQPYEAGADGVAAVRLTDPWGTSIELTEGLDRWSSQGPQRGAGAGTEGAR